MKRSFLMFLSLTLLVIGIILALLLWNPNQIVDSVLSSIIAVCGFIFVQINYNAYYRVKSLTNHMFSLFYIPLGLTIFGLITTIKLWNSLWEIGWAIGMIALINGTLWFLMCFFHIDEDYRTAKLKVH